MIPVGHTAGPSVILALARTLLARIFTALFTKGPGVEFVANLAVLLLDLQFDRQTVAVPARHEARIKPVKARGLDDHVLQHLVDGMTDVDVAIGIRRAVDEPELRSPRRGALNFTVQIVFQPDRKSTRLNSSH